MQNKFIHKAKRNLIAKQNKCLQWQKLSQCKKYNRKPHSRRVSPTFLSFRPSGVMVIVLGISQQILYIRDISKAKKLTNFSYVLPISWCE